MGGIGVWGNVHSVGGAHGRNAGIRGESERERDKAIDRVSVRGFGWMERTRNGNGTEATERASGGRGIEK
jgi:hypothetical protein